MADEAIILFDGICNLCNSSVQYVIKHDRAGIFKFATLQSETGLDLLRKYDLSSSDLNSFILIRNGQAFTKSTAALKVTKELKGMIKILYGFIIVPSIIRNVVYNIIAKNRYKWFGKKDTCMVPTAALEERFLK